MEDPGSLIGGAWLAQRYGLDLVMPLVTSSRIGGRRASQLASRPAVESYVEAMRPDATLRGHLTFHLKHEPPHFELLSRVFAACNAQEVADWVAEEPTGQYARRAAFLFEFFTDRALPVPADIGGSYHDAISADAMVVASPGQAALNRRWRIRDNMPGTRAFCPMVFKTQVSAASMGLDVGALIAGLELEFGADVLMRSAVWMTLRESRASFAIEGEAEKTDRVQRFADVMARRTGQGERPPLGEAELGELQREILGQRTTVQHFGLRQSPVFVGEVVAYQNIVHYIAPPPGDLAAMLAGLQTFLDRTRGQSPVMRSAVASFGFVYIHPLADGNGRVHRFLINDSLRRDGVVREPMILPVSSLMARDAAERRAYDRILDVISQPLMRTAAHAHHFAESPTRYPDGITSNFVFEGADVARHAWRFPNLSAHVDYTADILQRTIVQDMRDESRYLRSHGQARSAVKAVVEMPDAQIDRVIRSIQNHQGVLSGALRAEMPILEQPGVWEEIVQAVRRCWGDGRV